MLSLIDCTLVTEGITSKSKLRAEELSKHRCKVTAGEVTMDPPQMAAALATHWGRIFQGTPHDPQ